jgi:gluconokinase
LAAIRSRAHDPEKRVLDPDRGWAPVFGQDHAQTAHDPEKWAPVFGQDHAQTAHDPEKWAPVFGQDHAQTKSQSVTRVPGVAAVVVMGVSGAGKSTVGILIAARLGCPFRDADSFHPKANIEKMSRGEPLNDEDRWPWLRAIADWIAEHRAAGTTCVVTCSALKRAYRDIVTAHQRNDVRLVYLKGDFELIEARLKARTGHFMPPGLLRSQFDALEEPAADEHAITVSIDAMPDEIADRTRAALQRS